MGADEPGLGDSDTRPLDPVYATALPYRYSLGVEGEESSQ
jgi:hypothetical protein